MASADSRVLDERALARLAASRPRSRVNVRCVCGTMLAELFMHPADQAETGRLLTVPCDKCRYLLFKFAFDKRHPKHDLFVLSTVDLDTGRVIPGMAQAFLGADMRLRAGARGGKLLDPEILLDTIAELERRSILHEGSLTEG